MIKGQEIGSPIFELGRKHGRSLATFQESKAQEVQVGYGGADLSDAERPRQFEDEHAKSKRLSADAMPDNAVLKDLLGET